MNRDKVETAILDILTRDWKQTNEIRVQITRNGIKNSKWGLSNQYVSSVLAILKRQGKVEKLEKNCHLNFWRLSGENN